MNNARNRAISVGSALANLPRPHVMRRSQSTVTGITPRTVRVVLLGSGGVGKTAMAVRFITKRFIGDYDPTLETIYRHTTVIDNQLVNFEVLDTAGQEDNCLMLEDKCKWGESFIFVYDITDRYSFDELTRLKFTASYTHSKLRANFTPCWMLIGNKSDLAENERMVSTDEGVALARDLGCHVFREISVKESVDDACEVFEDLWREFTRLSPRSPSSSQRRKNACRIQDKISVLDSNACTCASEALKSIAHHHHHGNTNEMLVSTLTSSLRRKVSAPAMQMSTPRECKLYLFHDSNNNEEKADMSRSIPSIPENLEEEEKEEEEEEGPRPHPVSRYLRRRRNALVSDSASAPSTPPVTRRKALSADNVFKTLEANPNFDCNMMITSSDSSSNASLNSVSSSSSNSLGSKLGETVRFRSNSDASSLKRKNSREREDLMSLYQEHLRRNRSRKYETSRYNQPFTNSFTPMGFNATCEVRGY